MYRLFSSSPFNTPNYVGITMIAILSTLAAKLPIAFLERWLTHLEKKADSDNVRLIEMLKELLETKKLQAQIVIAEQNHWYTAMIRPLMALPIVIYTWKVVVWDKVFGWGVTDPLGDTMSWVFTAIVGAYFIARPFEKNSMKTKAAETIKNWRSK